MKTLKCLVILYIVVFTLVFRAKCQPESLQSYNSTSACFGDYVDETTMNATCNAGRVIAIGDITMGAKPDSVGCPHIYNASLGYSLCCTDNQNTDCLFPLFSGNKIYHDNCNGKPTCKRQATQQLVGTSCASFNGNFSEILNHFMFMEFFCIEEDKMADMCSGPTTLTGENTELYIWNKDFPTSSIQPTDTNCNCSVEIDNCQAGIDIYNIYRQLAATGVGTCNRTLRVGDIENNAILFEWTCDDDTLDFETHTVQNTYILIDFENQRIETDGKFWLGFKATADSNITVSCPPTAQQYCQPTTTTTTTGSTTTVTMTTMNTTATTTAATTTTATTATDTTEPSFSTSTTEPPSTSTTPANNETATSSDQKDNSFLSAVIVLGVLVAVLCIVVIVLACCLYRKCCTKTKDDVEKVVDGSKQSLPPPDVTQTMRPDFKQSAFSTAPAVVVPVDTADFGCQVQIDKVYITEGSLKKDIKQITEHVKKENLEKTITQAEIGCQVDLITPRIQTDKSKSKKVASSSPPVQLIDKGISTLPISQSNRQCQTDVLRKKSQKVQVNNINKPPVKVASCQTDTIVNEPKQEESKQVTTVPNWTIPKSLQDEQKTIPMGPESVITTHQRNKRKKKKKKRTIERHEEPDIRISSISPASLEAVKPEITHESPGNQTLMYKLATDMEEDTSNEIDTEVSEKSDKEIRTIHVRPESEASDALSTDVKHVLKIRKSITNSFFGKERHEEKFLREISKQSKKVRKKKKVNKTYSEC